MDWCTKCLLCTLVWLSARTILHKTLSLHGIIKTGNAQQSISSCCLKILSIYLMVQYLTKSQSFSTKKVCSLTSRKMRQSSEATNRLLLIYYRLKLTSLILRHRNLRLAQVQSQVTLVKQCFNWASHTSSTACGRWSARSS